MALRGRGLPLGCLGVFVLVLAGAWALYAWLAPWSFNMGGHWTPLTVWWGYGKLRVTTGDEYPLFIYFSPSIRRGMHQRYQQRSASGDLRGTAWLCTAPGVIQRLSLSGAIYGAGQSTDGSSILFRLFEPGAFDSGQGRYFNLGGAWQGEQLVMNDEGTWTMYFHPGPESVKASVAFSWGSYWDFKALCGAGPK